MESGERVGQKSKFGDFLKAERLGGLVYVEKEDFSGFIRDDYVVGDINSMQRQSG